MRDREKNANSFAVILLKENASLEGFHLFDCINFVNGTSSSPARGSEKWVSEDLKSIDFSEDMWVMAIYVPAAVSTVRLVQAQVEGG